MKTVFWGVFFWIVSTLVLALVFFWMGTGSLSEIVRVSAVIWLKPVIFSGCITTPVALVGTWRRLKRRHREALEQTIETLAAQPLPEGVVHFRIGARYWPPAAWLLFLVPVILGLGQWLFNVWMTSGPDIDLWGLLGVEVFLVAYAGMMAWYLYLAFRGGAVITLGEDYIEWPVPLLSQKKKRWLLQDLVMAGFVGDTFIDRRYVISNGTAELPLLTWLMPQLEMQRLDRLIESRWVAALIRQRASHSVSPSGPDWEA